LGLKPDIIRCASANDPAVLERIKKHSPEIVLCAGATHIMGKELLSIPSVAAINLHWSLLPAYVGTAPYFWCLLNGEHRSGVTLHIMTKKLDAGPIIDQ